MKINILAFGIAKDIVKGSSTILHLETEKPTVKDLKNALMATFPAFSDLASLAIAVNEEYADDHQPITERDEVVLIPPVSGG